MPGRIDRRLAALGLVLPPATAPVANYLPFVRTGSLVLVSGQIPVEGGKPAYLGKLGRELSVEDGARAARLCALSLIAHLRNACEGDLDRVARTVKLLGFVNGAPDFADQPRVVNGASDLIVQVFGEAGRHARSAVGVAALPFGVAVEVEGLFEIG